MLAVQNLRLDSYCHLPDGTQIGITVQEPRPPATTVTLHPIPFETPLNEIANIVTNQQWGKLLRQQFGHYREFPEFQPQSARLTRKLAYSYRQTGIRLKSSEVCLNCLSP